MRPRRAPLKRVAVWTTVVLSFFAWYVLAAPFIAFFGQKYLPAAEPVFKVAYAPLIYVAKFDDAPGHAPFTAYLNWSHGILRRLLD